MKPQEYLSQLQILDRRIAYRAVRLRRLEGELDAVRSPWGGRAGGSPSGEAPYVRLLERLESEKEELERENELRGRLQRQVEETVGRLPDENMRLVLLYRYLEEKTYTQIGELLCMDRSTAWRWAEKALARLVLPENPISIPAAGQAF